MFIQPNWRILRHLDAIFVVMGRTILNTSYLKAFVLYKNSCVHVYFRRWYIKGRAKIVSYILVTQNLIMYTIMRGSFAWWYRRADQLASCSKGIFFSLEHRIFLCLRYGRHLILLSVIL